MRAAMIKAFGEQTEVLELVDVPEPTGPAAGEVLVSVEYAPINMNDLYVVHGAFPVRPSLPSIVGNEGVGRVLENLAGRGFGRAGNAKANRYSPGKGA
jgi:NADPH:quinone reductase-like Zn-dependent oxidoreductase